MEWIAAILVFIFALSVTSFTVHADRPSVVQLFVAPDGSDENDGSITGPFATLEKARDTVRLLRKPAVVNLRAGVYHLSTSFLLDERDKDTVYQMCIRDSTTPDFIHYISFKLQNKDCLFLLLLVYCKRLSRRTRIEKDF